MSGIYGGGGGGGGGGTGILSITGNSGGAIDADGSNNINVVGATNQVTVAGSGHTETISLTGPYTPATYTAHGVLIGEGTSSIVATTPGTTGQVLIGSTGADPAFGAIGVNSGLTAHSLVVSEGNSAFVALGAATNGQIPIGSTGADPVLATITAGSNITVTNGAGSITIASTGGGAVSSVTGTTNEVTASPTTGAVVLTIPSTFIAPGSIEATTTLKSDGNFTAAAGQYVSITTPGAYPYTTLATDFLILIDTSAARTITPIGSPTTGQMYRIKDNVGSAAINNITVTPSGKNIDGVASKVINTNYGSIDIIYNGTQWNIL